MFIKNDSDPNKIPLRPDIFPNYTLEMWRGNVPSGIGHMYIRSDGSTAVADRWQTRFGGGESVDGQIVHAEFNLNRKVSVFICGQMIVVTDIRHDGQYDFWQWSSNPDFAVQGVRHDLQPDRLAQYLTAQVEDCLFWKMVQAKAKRLAPDVFE